jgi:hypothetical protein
LLDSQLADMKRVRIFGGLYDEVGSILVGG